MRGDLSRALAINPFDTLFFLAAAPLFAGLWVANLAGGFAVRISMSPAERRGAWALLVAVALANWAYVLVTHR
jgi:FtsH-binding integral membrane protein